MSKTGCIILFILSGIIMPFFSLLQVKSSSAESFLDKRFSGSLKGLFAVYIALHHLVLLSNSSYRLLLPLKNLGYLCVAFFFMMSGYGLTLGYLKSGLKSFVRKRVLKIFIPYILSNLIVGVLYLIFMDDVKISDIFIKLLQLKPIYSEGMLWYVYVQIVMYIFFWISFRFMPEKKNNLFKLLALITFTFIYIIICKITNENQWRYNTVLCFSLGVALSLYKDKLINIMKNHYIKLVLPTALLFSIGYALVIMNKYNLVMSVLSSLLFAFLSALLSYKISIHSKLLSFLGDISYEYYIFQLPIIKIVLKNIDASYDYLYSGIIIIATMILASCAHKLSDYICKKTFHS